MTLTRQRVVLAERSPRLEFVIAEGALHQVVGGAAVMRPQLSWLADLAGAGGASLSLQVLPFTAGAYAAAGCGSMSVLRFADTPGLGVIHLAALSGGVSLEDQDEVARYIRTFAQLRSAALTPAASARLLREYGQGLMRGPAARCPVAAPGVWLPEVRGPGCLSRRRRHDSARLASACLGVALAGTESCLLTTSSFAMRSWMSRSC